MNYKIKIDYKEFLYTLILPLLITFVYLFFRNNKDILAYNRSNFKFWQIYTKDFINDSFIHYFGNVIVILIVSIVLFLLLSKIRREYLTKYLLFFVVLIVPPLTSISDILFVFPRSSSNYFLGSSNIASALIGLVMFFFSYIMLKKEFNVQKVYYYTLLIVVFIFSWIYYFKLSTIFLYVILALLIFFYKLIFARKIKFRKFFSHNKVAKIVIVLFIYILLLQSSFPNKVDNINILGHYFGLALGVIMGNLTSQIHKLN